MAKPIVHCALCIVHCALCIVHCALTYGHKKSCSTLNEGNSFKLFVVFRVSLNSDASLSLGRCVSSAVSGSSSLSGSGLSGAVLSGSVSRNNLLHGSLSCEGVGILSSLLSIAAREERYTKNNSK